jgi:hypothetical protein
MPMLLDCPVAEDTWHSKAAQTNGTPTPRPNASEDRERKTDAGPWQETVQKIVEFQHLADDWDGQGARPPSAEMLESAIGLAYTLLQNGMDPPNCVVPGLEGEVTFEWHEPDGTYAEVEIVRPFHAEVMMIEPGQAAKHWTLPTS